MKRKAIIALSGGVDSSVCAAMLIEQGFDVKAIHIKSWDSFVNKDNQGMAVDCEQGRDYQDAKRVADFLGIELIKLDYVKEYWDNVFHTALEEFKKGLTPNPDNFCNKFIKFGFLSKYINENYPDTLLVTGHYAKVSRKNGIELLKALDHKKDQSYFLSRVNHEALKNTFFPLGGLSKDEVRVIAKDKNLHTYNKKDSTGLCFVGERKFEDFLLNYLEPKEGDIIDFDTKKIIGKHKGYYFYTIGQNSNLNLGGQKERKAVYKKVPSQNVLYVIGINDERHFKKNFSITNLNVIGNEDIDILHNEKLTVKVRYQGKEVKCKMMGEKKKLSFSLKEKIKFITPGQEAVFYIGDRCIGGGTINKAW